MLWKLSLEILNFKKKYVGTTCINIYKGIFPEEPIKLLIFQDGSNTYNQSNKRIYVHAISLYLTYQDTISRNFDTEIATLSRLIANVIPVLCKRGG